MKPLQPGEVMYCLHCHRKTEAIDPGDPFPACSHCKSRKLVVRTEQRRRVGMTNERFNQLLSGLRAAVDDL